MSAQDWIDAYEALPLVSDATWKQNLADYCGDLIDNILALSTYSAGAFTFGRSQFASALTDTDGVVGLQSAFSAGVSASTWVINSGTTFGAATPAETFSTSGVAVADPAGISAGQALIAALTGAPQVGDPTLSEFPTTLRNAFLALTFTVTGTNSVAPTPGPINDVARAVTGI